MSWLAMPGCANRRALARARLLTKETTPVGETTAGPATMTSIRYMASRYLYLIHDRRCVVLSRRQTLWSIGRALNRGSGRSGNQLLTPGWIVSECPAWHRAAWFEIVRSSTVRRIELVSSESRRRCSTGTGIVHAALRPVIRLRISRRCDLGESHKYRNPG